MWVASIARIQGRNYRDVALDMNLMYKFRDDLRRLVSDRLSLQILLWHFAIGQARADEMGTGDSASGRHLFSDVPFDDDRA